MRNFFRSTSGFTFVEAVIALSIVGIFLALTWATVSFLVLKTGEQIVRSRAHFLAVEGVELVKQIRQTAVNRNQRNGFYRSIGDKAGTYILAKMGDEYQLVSGANQLVEIMEEPYTVYCRTVEITGDGRQGKEIAVTVRWGDAADCRLGKQEVVYSTFLADTSQ